MSTRTGAVREAGIWRIGTWDKYQTLCPDELRSRKSGSLMFGLGRRVERQGGSCSSRVEQVLRKKPKAGLAQVFLPQALGVEIVISNSYKASCEVNRCPYEYPNSTPFARHHTRRVWPTLHKNLVSNEFAYMPLASTYPIGYRQNRDVNFCNELFTYVLAWLATFCCNVGIGGWNWPERHQRLLSIKLGQRIRSG
jgi:hypothetical protein